MPARSRRAPAPPARRQVRICRAGLGQGPGAGGPGGGRQPLSHGPLGPVTKLGRTLGLRPGRRTCRQVSRPERAARAGGLPSGEGSAPPTPDPNPVSGGGGRRAGREKAGWGARRSGGPGAPSRLAPPVLLSGPGDKLRGKQGPRAGERVATGATWASRTWALPGSAARSRPGGAQARPALPAPGSSPRRGWSGRREGASPTRSRSEQPTCRGSRREASVWELGVGRGTANASLPEPHGSRLIFLLCEWGVSIPSHWKCGSFGAFSEFRTQAMCQ